MNNPISIVENCDCMEYMKTIPDKFFDLACVDPPFGINAPNMQMGSAPKRKGNGQYPGVSTSVKLKGRLNSGGGHMKNSLLVNDLCEWDKVKPTSEYFKELFRISKNQIIKGGNYFTNNLPESRCWICWDKLQPWENFSQIEMLWTSYDMPAKLFRMSNTGGANHKQKIHPTEAPQELYFYCFNLAKLKPGSKIFDSHLGSGNSRIVAYKMGFDFYGTEIDKDYFNDSCKAFDREINGIIQTKSEIITQLKMF
jgi:site-specific DNA-methyltransferase (adenine-specific)